MKRESLNSEVRRFDIIHGSKYVDNPYRIKLSMSRVFIQHISKIKIRVLTHSSMWSFITIGDFIKRRINKQL